ncbi:MAG: ABC transporter permease [Clostridia bacterium]|nr:ABC transporter permease [Clostridia bacterium]
MNSIEKEEIRSLPSKYRPLGAWAYFGYQLLFSIPLVGLICMIVFACSSDNINRRSYARSFFCVYLIIGIVLIIVLVAGGGCVAAMFARR